MRSFLLLAIGVTAACVATAPSPRPVPAASELDEATALARTHALFAAFDGHDADAVDAQLGGGFVLFRDLRQIDRSFLVERLRARRAERVPARSRTCTEERVARGPNVAVYLGDCRVHEPSDGDSPAEAIDGWNTVVWAYDGATWTVAHWGWKPGGVAAERDMWNDTFRQDVGFKHTANQLLIDTVAGRRPGAALDLLTGQGRNALYLASQGWKVTGVDISDVGIAAARDAAARAKLALDLVVADVDTYPLGTDAWDLVTMIYAGSDPTLIARAKASIRPGGLFVVEFFLKEGGPMGFEAGELAAHFAGWTIVRDEVVEDVADWSLQVEKLVRFVAQRPIEM